MAQTPEGARTTCEMPGSPAHERGEGAAARAAGVGVRFEKKKKIRPATKGRA